jgi:hypothetical protein
MKAQEQITDLHEAIAAHAGALADAPMAAERVVLPAAMQDWRKAAAEIAQMKRPIEVKPLGLAKIGAQYISKVGIENAAGRRVVLYRWRREADGRWLVAGVEDISGKRSPWSDVPDLATAAAERRARNGNA